MTDDDLKRLIDAVRQESAEAQAETRRLFGAAVERVEDRMDASRTEMRRYFEVAAESIKHEVRLVAEAVAGVDEKLDRDVERLEEKIDRGFAETQAMIKFSHAELDRRVRALEGSQRSLEESLANLQARVERLESTTH